jgi:integrase
MSVRRDAWIERRKSKKEGYLYYVRYYDANGMQRCIPVGNRESKARGIRDEITRKLNSGDYREPKKVTLDEFVAEDQDLVRATVTKASLVDQRKALKRFTEFCRNPSVKKGEDPVQRLRAIRLVNEVTKVYTEKFRNHLVDQKLAPATVNKYMRTLKAAFQRAMGRSYIGANPFKGIKPLWEPPEPQKRILEDWEVEKLLAACPNPRWRLFIYLALVTGMRKGEIQYLEWKDVDLNRGMVEVKCKPEHRTKTGQERRLPLTPSAVILLQAWRKQSTGRWVFLTSLGTLMLNNTNKQLARIVREAGLEHCCFHDMRKTLASHMDLKTAQKMLGHRSITTTARYYAGSIEKKYREAVEALPYASPKVITNLSPIGAQVRQFEGVP